MKQTQTISTVAGPIRITEERTDGGGLKITAVVHWEHNIAISSSAVIDERTVYEAKDRLLRLVERDILRLVRAYLENGIRNTSFVKWEEPPCD